MAAITREEAIEHVLTAALATFAGAGVIVSRIALWTISGVDQMSVIASRGLEAARIDGAHMQVRTSGSVSRTTRPAQSHHTVDAATAGAMAELLGFALPPWNHDADTSAKRSAMISGGKS